MPSRCTVLLLALACACACWGPRAAAYTKPDQLQIITAFRDAMLARPVHTNWAKALATWTCPTNPANSVGGTCDPCGQLVWGNWDHVACRGERVTYTKEKVPGDGTINHIHITDMLIEGPVPLAELCPLTGLVEFDVDGGDLTGTIPSGFAACYPQLIELDLSYNRLTGTLPPEIADVKTLEQFKVEDNSLSGTIPAEYGNMATVNWMRFSDNNFTGSIPSSLANTALHMSQLTLDGNDFEGDLYALSDHSMISFNAANNPRICGMVPVGLRFAHGFNYANSGLGLPCPEETANGWVDLSETL
ncbi:hypothetical protein D9Q98_007906 [Chlorella vulgaris]|uniref:Uncharacterized protein n=1 Tax=Chlorella vulgaris TaxID=3077 RepID=A0A9D4THT2_CHLVU|nr:hypothetical protein D9Q98_007906 [Chlorella vulgaris]